jgi:hypothetical protein
MRALLALLLLRANRVVSPRTTRQYSESDPSVGELVRARLVVCLT